MRTRISYWLLPTKEAARFLQHIIIVLAERYNAPLFQPHVTLFSTDASTIPDPGGLLEAAVVGLMPLALTVDGCRYTDEFTKTFFIQFRPSDQFAAITERLRASASGASGSIPNPHLSLIYKHMREEEQKELVEIVQAPTTHICFDQVSAISHAPRILSREDVEGWREVCRIRLGS